MATTGALGDNAGLARFGAAMPTFPEGFPPDLIAKLEAALGRKTLCHKPYSGTQVIHDYGREHLATGALIVCSSADSASSDRGS